MAWSWREPQREPRKRRNTRNLENGLLEVVRGGTTRVLFNLSGEEYCELANWFVVNLRVNERALAIPKSSTLT